MVRKSTRDGEMYRTRKSKKALPPLGLKGQGRELLLGLGERHSPGYEPPVRAVPTCMHGNTAITEAQPRREGVERPHSSTLSPNS